MSSGTKVSKSVRNKKLYDYIVENYIKAEKPVTQQQIADNFGMSIGAIKNFMYRHGLNKKTYYAKIRKQIKGLYDKGLTVKQISKLMDTTSQYIYYVNSIYDVEETKEK